MNEPQPILGDMDSSMEVGGVPGGGSFGYIPDMEALSGVLSENHSAMRESSGITNIVNVSTEMVETNEAFNSGDYEAQVRAQAGTAEHLKLITMAQGQNESLMQMTNEFNHIAQSLGKVRMPDTRVKIAGQKLEGAYDIKQYANDLNQGMYAARIGAMLGRNRMDQLRRYCNKANMSHTPALWLNQALDYESQKNYVYTIGQAAPQAIANIEQALSADAKHKLSNTLQGVLGPHLYGKMQRTADSQQCSVFTMFVILVDGILDRHHGSNAPVTAHSIWDDVTTPAAPEQRAIITAQYAREVRR